MNTYQKQFAWRGMRLLALLAFGLVAGVVLAPKFAAQQPHLQLTIPLGLPADTLDYYVPRHNPLTPAKVELGRKLFFEPRLSADGQVSCASCHDPKLAFTDGKPVAEGIYGRRGTRNSPTILNALFNAGQFWDGRADTLEEQAIQPLTNPLEMGNRSYDDVVARLRAIPEYRAEFKALFGGEVKIEWVGLAISAYERTLLSGDSAFDRFIAGDAAAISEDAKRGFAIFRGRGRCSRCHTFNEQVPFFSDFNYHNTGVAANHANFDRLARLAFAATDTDQAKEMIDKLAKEPGGDELGRILISYQVFDIGAYRTPSLRNIAVTAPYFHDGSAQTLADVVRFYNDGGRQNINREWDLFPLGLTAEEQRDLVTFLETLTGKETFQCCAPGKAKSTISHK
ncbi:MAG: cytochrome-c peroxidase [Acidobacteria bacterium]|nr:cytochrome-c peroxidase [Acidobacteriota bacterium]